MVLVSHCHLALHIWHSLIVLHRHLGSPQTGEPTRICNHIQGTCFLGHIDSIGHRFGALTELVLWVRLLYFLVGQLLGWLIGYDFVTSDNKGRLLCVDVFCWATAIADMYLAWTVRLAYLKPTVCFAICLVTVHNVDCVVRVYEFSLSLALHSFDSGHHGGTFANFDRWLFTAPLLIHCKALLAFDHILEVIYLVWRDLLRCVYSLAFKNEVKYTLGIIPLLRKFLAPNLWSIETSCTVSYVFIAILWLILVYLHCCIPCIDDTVAADVSGDLRVYL